MRELCESIKFCVLGTVTSAGDLKEMNDLTTALKEFIGCFLCLKLMSVSLKRQTLVSEHLMNEMDLSEMTK